MRFISELIFWFLYIKWSNAMPTEKSLEKDLLNKLSDYTQEKDIKQISAHTNKVLMQTEQKMNYSKAENNFPLLLNSVEKILQQLNLYTLESVIDKSQQQPRLIRSNQIPLDSENTRDLSFGATFNLISDEDANMADNSTIILWDGTISDSALHFIRHVILKPLLKTMDVLTLIPLVHMNIPLLIITLIARTILAIIVSILDYVHTEGISMELLQTFKNIFEKLIVPVSGQEVI